MKSSASLNCLYIRDSGLVHALLNLKTMDVLLGHPVVGAIWEAFVVENLISCLPAVTPWFYMTSAGAEIDLVSYTLVEISILFCS